MHKHRDVLITRKDQFGGICLPAHLKAYFNNSAMQFIKDIDTSYFIDPMTYIFAQKYVNLLDNKGHLKKSIEKLCNEYGDLCKIFKEKKRDIKPNDFTPQIVSNFSKSVIEYQKEGSREVDHLYDKYSKYISSSGSSTGPEFLVVPYFHFESPDDSWFDVNNKLIIESIENNKSTGDKLFCVICTKSEAISTETKREKIISEFNIEGIDGFIIWLDHFSEYDASVSDLKNLKSFIVDLAKTGKYVLNMYGSYYSAILCKVGLTAFGHGPHYGEAKEVESKMGGGPLLPRCYFDKLHKFLTTKYVVDNLHLLESIGLLSPNEHFDFNSENECISRFIESRNKELIEVSEKTKDGLVEVLRKTYEKYSPRIEKLDFLDKWVKAL